MANKFRHVRGSTNPVPLTAYAADTIEVGDILWWDATNDAVRPASEVGGATYAEQKTALAAAFVGVALEAKAASEPGSVLVGTAGDYLFTSPTAVSAEPLDYVVGGDGSAIADQTVVGNATAADAIGRVLAPKATTDDTVLIRILSKFNLG